MGPQNVKILGPQGPKILKLWGPGGPKMGGPYSHMTPGEVAAHESQSIFCYSGSYSEQRPSRMCGHRAHNLLVLRSPQFSFLRSDREVQCAGTNLCWRCTCFSPTSEGSATVSRSKHWSDDCQIFQTCSTSPVGEKQYTVKILCTLSLKQEKD